MAVKIAHVIHRVARVWSFLVWLLGLILLLAPRGEGATLTPQNGPLDFLIPLSLLLSLIGLAVAFRREGTGVLLNLGFFFAILPLHWLLHHQWMPPSILIGLSPVILPGVLFAAAGLLKRKAAQTAVPPKPTREVE